MPVTTGLIERRIYLIRGQKVMLDADLAELYQVPTKALNQAVKRNLERFPEDFMFQLTSDEAVSAPPAFCPTRSRNMAWPCCPRCFAASGRCR
jgi:hypothetical protein